MYAHEEPTGWVAAEEEAPGAVRRWLALFAQTVDWLGGDASDVPGPLRLEVSTDGRPRLVRLSLGSQLYGLMTLLNRANLDLWIQGHALHEYFRQQYPKLWPRPSGPPPQFAAEPPESERVEIEEVLPPPMQRIQELLGASPDSEQPTIRTFRQPDDADLITELDQLNAELEETETSGWIGATRYAFEPLSVQRGALIEPLLDRYAMLFIHFAALPPARTEDAKRSLSLTVPTDRSQSVVRCTSHFTGGTCWLYDWDGTDASLVQFIEDEAFNHAEWVHDDRSIAGPTPWDSDPS
jgi:hypothetical protein